MSRGPFPLYACFNAMLTTRAGVIIICGRFPGTTCHVSWDDGLSWPGVYTVDPTGANSQGTMFEAEDGVVLFLYGGQDELRSQTFKVAMRPPTFEWIEYA